MIIFLYGPDNYRRIRKKRELIAEFQKKHSGLGAGEFDLEIEAAFFEFQNFIKNQSIFEPVKLAVLENIFTKPEDELIAELKSLISNKHTTVLLSEKEKPVKVFNFLLKKPVLVQKFDYLEGGEWRKFIAEEAKKFGVKLSDSALYFFTEIYKNDTWLAVTELQKISLLDKQIIEKSDLENLELELAPNFWELLSGLRRPVLRERVAALTKLFATNEPAGKIFNLAAYTWPEKLRAIAGYDLAVKSGKMDYEEALLDLVIS
jgi:DNA polymerase III delta subunit